MNRRGRTGFSFSKNELCIAEKVKCSTSAERSDGTLRSATTFWDSTRKRLVQHNRVVSVRPKLVGREKEEEFSRNNFSLVESALFTGTLRTSPFPRADSAKRRLPGGLFVWAERLNVNLLLRNSIKREQKMPTLLDLLLCSTENAQSVPNLDGDLSDAIVSRCVCLFLDNHLCDHGFTRLQFESGDLSASGKYNGNYRQ